MDSRRFDILTKSLSRTDTRRSIAKLLAVLPLGAVLTALLENERDATAKDDDHGSSHRRHRRKAEHRHQTGKDKENRKGKRKGKGKGKRKVTLDPGCQPELDAAACGSRTCGTTRNSCGQTVVCGDCLEGRVCLGNGICAFSCTLGGSMEQCLPCPGVCRSNLSGGPPGICTSGIATCTDDCAKCAAAGQVCRASSSEFCDPPMACVAPC